MNKLAIISIQSKKLKMQRKASDNHLVFQDQRHGWLRFSNYLSLETRFMWNIYLYMENSELFEFFPFVDLIANFLVLDSRHPMSISTIEYFLKWKEHPNPQPNSEHKREFTMQCPEFLIELNSKTKII